MLNESAEFQNGLGLGHEALLAAPSEAEICEGFTIAEGTNLHLERYFRIHRVLVGERGGILLEDIYRNLRTETTPELLNAAGSAAVEAVLVGTDRSTMERLALLDGAIVAWKCSLVLQEWANEYDYTEDETIDHASPYRTALDIATVPLLAGLLRVH